MRLSRHQLWSGSSYDGAACRPRRCPVQLAHSDHTQLCREAVKLVPMADLSALPSCSTSPWRQTLERPRKNSHHHARSTRTPTHTSSAGPKPSPPVSSSRSSQFSVLVPILFDTCQYYVSLSAADSGHTFFCDKPNKLKLRFPVESTL